MMEVAVVVFFTRCASRTIRCSVFGGCYDVRHTDLKLWNLIFMVAGFNFLNQIINHRIIDHRIIGTTTTIPFVAPDTVVYQF